MENKSWLEELAEQCLRTSQKKVADKLQVSTALINQVLKEKYPGDLTRIEQLVKGAFMQYSVTCPVLGEIEKHKCLFHQARDFAATNPQRVMLHKACRSGCPHSQLETTMTSEISIKLVDVDPAQAIVPAEFYGVKEVLAAIEQGPTSRTQHIELLEQELASLAKQYNQLVQTRIENHD